MMTERWDIWVRDQNYHFTNTHPYPLIEGNYYMDTFTMPYYLSSPTCSESFFNRLISKDRFLMRSACVNDSHEALLSYVLVITKRSRYIISWAKVGD